MNIVAAKYLKDVTNDTNTNGILVTDGTSNKIVVPIDPANTDYAAILEWVAEGNTIQDAD
jgi:hypothetical protein